MFFFLQEYQHVHLFWFKKGSFTLVWKPNPLLHCVHGAHLHTDTVSINQTLPTKRLRCRAFAEAPPLKARLFTWSMKSESCYSVPWLCSACCMKQTLWSSADHVLARVRQCQIYTRTLSKNGRSLELWYIQWGKKVFSQPPIVQVLPLKKMREACNFHHRYTSTMRDKIRKENHIVGFLKNLLANYGGK